MDKIACPHCGQMYEADPWAALAFTCWRCGKQYIVHSEINDPTTFAATPPKES